MDVSKETKCKIHSTLRVKKRIFWDCNQVPHDALGVFDEFTTMSTITAPIVLTDRSESCVNGAPRFA